MGATVRTFTIAEAAELTGLSRKAVARRVERGSLRSVVRNGRRRIPRSELVRAGLLPDGDQAAPEGGPGALLLPRPGPGSLDTAAGSEDVLAVLVRELLDRLERQSAEMAQMRALTAEAESLRLTNELTELRVRISELERERPEGEQSPHATEVSSRISELSRQVQELASREIWLPPHARGRTTPPHPPQTAPRAPQPAPAAEPVTPQPVALQPHRSGPGRRVLRFVLEAAFLVAVAVVAWQADLRQALIGAAMAAAWLVVACAEWLASRHERARSAG
jgi:excisionase family DNA binding protein